MSQQLPHHTDRDAESALERRLRAAAARERMPLPASARERIHRALDAVDRARVAAAKTSAPPARAQRGGTAPRTAWWRAAAGFAILIGAAFLLAPPPESPPPHHAGPPPLSTGGDPAPEAHAHRDEPAHDDAAPAVDRNTFFARLLDQQVREHELDSYLDAPLLEEARRLAQRSDTIVHSIVSRLPSSSSRREQ